MSELAGESSGSAERPESGAGGGMSTSTVRLAVSWALVALLLGYGIVQTVITAAKLF